MQLGRDLARRLVGLGDERLQVLGELVDRFFESSDRSPTVPSGTTQNSAQRLKEIAYGPAGKRQTRTEGLQGELIQMLPEDIGKDEAKEAIQYLVILYETLGPRWMTPDWFRFGASSLLNDVLMQIEYQRTGRYQDPDHFTLD